MSHSDDIATLIEQLRSCDAQIRLLVIGRHRPWLPIGLLRRLGYLPRIDRLSRIDEIEIMRREVIASLMTKVFENIQSQAAAIVMRPYGALAEDQAKLREEWEAEQKQKDAGAAALQHELEAISTDILRIKQALGIDEELQP